MWLASGPRPAYANRNASHAYQSFFRGVSENIRHPPRFRPLVAGVQLRAWHALLKRVIYARITNESLPTLLKEHGTKSRAALVLYDQRQRERVHRELPPGTLALQTRKAVNQVMVGAAYDTVNSRRLASILTEHDAPDWEWTIVGQRIAIERAVAHLQAEDVTRKYRDLRRQLRRSGKTSIIKSMDEKRRAFIARKHDPTAPRLKQKPKSKRQREIQRRENARVQRQQDKFEADA